MVHIPTLSEIKAAGGRIKGKAIRTPLLHHPGLSDYAGVDVYLKLESLQVGGAFKFRGATNAVALLTPEQRRKGVVTASSGNHGIATALAARSAGVRATIIVPRSAPKVKIERIKRAGAEVIVHGKSYGDAEEQAYKMAREGYFFLHPFDLPAVVAGQGTIGLEIDQDAPPDLAHVLVPVGGGGLISGITLAMRYTRPDVKVVGVEPERGASLTAAIKAGGPVAIEPQPTCADGLQPRTTGHISYEVCKDGPMPVLLTEEELLEGVRYCFEEVGLVVEPSGGAGIAAILSHKFQAKGPVVVIVSGSNLDRKWLKKALGL